MDFSTAEHCFVKFLQLVSIIVVCCEYPYAMDTSTCPIKITRSVWLSGLDYAGREIATLGPEERPIE